MSARRPPKDEFRSRYRRARGLEVDETTAARAADDADATVEPAAAEPIGAPPAPEGEPGAGGGWPAWAVVDWDALETDDPSEAARRSVPPTPREFDDVRDQILSVASQAAAEERRAERDRREPADTDDPTRVGTDAGPDVGPEPIEDLETPRPSANGRPATDSVFAVPSDAVEAASPGPEATTSRADEVLDGFLTEPGTEKGSSAAWADAGVWATPEVEAPEAEADEASEAEADEAPEIEADEAPEAAAVGPLKAEVVEPGSAETGLSLSPERLWDLVKEAAWAAQEARERAARAEGESVVLRREVERLREERADLVAQLAERRRWFTRRRR